jgi:hypothetical protein
MNVKSVYAAMWMATLATGATAACEQETVAGDEISATTLPLIIREWSWSDGVSSTTFTAYGPPQQVNGLDPQNGLVQCPGCELASSVQFGPADRASPDQAGGLGFQPINISD